MSFEPTDKVKELIAQVDQFMDDHVFQHELDYWHWVDDAKNEFQYPPWFEGLKAKARDAALVIPVQINGKVRQKISVPNDTSKDDLESLARNDEKIAEALAGKNVVKTIVVPGRLVNFVAK